MKLSDYSKEEKRAVFNHFFQDTPSVRLGDLTETQLLNIMKSFNGSRIVFAMRIRNFWKEVKAAAERNRKK